VIGTGVAGFNGDRLDARESELYLPTDIFKYADGRIGVVDYNNYRIRRLESDGTLETVAGNGLHAYATVGAPVLETAFENPISAIATEDGLWIAAEHEGRVLKIDQDEVVEVVAGTGNLGDSGDGGDALLAELTDPTGLAFLDGELYISDRSTERIRRIADGKIEAVADGLSQPQKIAAIRGEIWIADSGNHRIQVWNPEAQELRTEIDAGLDTPWAVVEGPDGSVFIADSRSHTIQQWKDGELSPVVGDGYAGLPLDEPMETDDVRLNYPAGLCWDDETGLWIANMLGNQVLLWKPDSERP